MRESDLYLPLKTYFEGQGAQVAAEVNHTDMVVRQGDLVFAVELKTSFSLALVYQLLNRRGAFDGVYAAIPVIGGRIPNRRNMLSLLASLGFGLISVEFLKTKTKIQVVLQCNRDLRKGKSSSVRRERILREIDSRYAELTLGGLTSRETRLSAYRQQALHLLWLMHRKKIQGKPIELQKCGAPAKTGVILRANIYGWFTRTSRGNYAASEEGEHTLEFHDTILSTLEPLWESYLSRSLQK